VAELPQNCCERVSHRRAVVGNEDAPGRRLFGGFDAANRRVGCASHYQLSPVREGRIAARRIVCNIALHRLHRQGDRRSAGGRLVRIDGDIEDADDRRKDEFLAMLAHELRNPLAPISNAVHVLQISAQDPAKLTWASEVIGRQLRQLVRLVDDLLDVSRITRGKIELKLGPIDVATVVGAAVETSRSFVVALEHELTIVLPPEPLLVMGDFARVAQILSNLINNAAKYTDKGGRISVTATGERGQVVFRVRDSGVGIPRHLLSSIFELFTQADRTLGRSQGGLGVGLALVQRLVEMQGGSVSGYSVGPDRGSEFTVRLPAANATKPVDDESLETPSRLATTAPDACILIVDDNHDVADSTAMLLRAVGWKVHLAYDGEEAIRSARTLHPDAILLDIGLPGVDGYQVAERIRAEPGNRAPLIVAVSGYGQEEHRRRSQQAGFDHHVVKPIDPTVLTQLLASALHSRRGAAAETALTFPDHGPLE
jgi:signal transduction histidine kinase/ActR/RegA family two-component response regulator